MIQFDAQSMEYLATRQLTREECCRAFGIEPSLLGVRPANFASLDMYHQMLYQDTLAPICVSIQEEFEEQYLTEWESVLSGYHFDFNLTAKLAGSFLEQAKIGQQAVGGPWMSGNEFRKKFMGLEPKEGLDDIIVPKNVVRGGGPQANPQDATNQFTKAEDIASVLRLASEGDLS
jgi:HK97 family phage portal protein